MGLKNSNAATEMKARPEPSCSRAHPRAGRPDKVQSRSLTRALSGAIAAMAAARSIPGSENGANKKKGRGSRILEIYLRAQHLPD